MQSLTTCFFDTLDYLKSILCSPASILLAAVAWVSSRFSSTAKPMRFSCVLLIMAFTILAPFVINFPVFFGGYGGFPERVQFINRLTAIISWSAAEIAIIQYLKAKGYCEPIGKKQIATGFISMLILCSSVLLSTPTDEYAALGIIDDLLDGDLKRVESYWKGLFQEWEQSAGQDVKVLWALSDKNRSPFLVEPIVTLDVNAWENQAVAQYFHLSSIAKVDE